MKKILADQAQRDRAIRTLDRPLIIEAGAGTGKTTLLVQRLLYALEKGVIAMDGVVAISFTEKSAAELRLRLRQAIERRASEVENSEARRYLDHALKDFHRASVSTIHAYASSLLRERPIEAGVDPQFHNLDAIESSQLHSRFWRQWVNEQLDSADAEQMLAQVLSLGVQLEPDLFQLGRVLYEDRDFSVALPPEIPSDLLVDAMQRMRQQIIAVAQHAAGECHEVTDLGLVHLLELKEKMSFLAYRDPRSWAGDFLYDVKIKVGAGNKKNWAPGQKEASKQKREDLDQQLTKLRQDLQNNALRHSLKWLRRYVSAFEAEKTRLGVLDFSDLLLKSRNLIRDDLQVRKEFGNRIQTLCIDEFQDTDPFQAELALFLSEAESTAAHWTKVKVGAKLFLVGDPRQSIYRFRRADLGLYARCCSIVRNCGGEILDITQNFRSRPAILDWVNGVFPALFQEDLSGRGTSPSHVPLQAYRDDAKQTGVWILQQKSEEGPAKLRFAEGMAIGRMIHRAIQEEWSVESAEGPRALRYGDVALLFGRTSGIEQYEEALRQQHIPFRQEGGKLFFQRSEVADVMNALGALEDPHDELQIVAALRSPLFGMGDDELWQHKAAFKNFNYIKTVQGSPLAGAFQILKELHEQRHALGGAGCIEFLLDRTHAWAIYSSQPEGARCVANFEALVRQAKRAEKRQPGGLRDFISSLRQLVRDAPRLAEYSPEEFDGEQVRLLTVHMAKGLEFPMVFLSNLGTRPNTQNPTLIVDALNARAEFRLRNSHYEATITTANYEEATQLNRSLDEEEARRLLYVAATRARDYLIIGDFAGGKDEGYLKALRNVEGSLGSAEFGALGAPGVGLRWQVQDALQLPENRSPVSSANSNAPTADDLLQRRKKWSADQTRLFEERGLPWQEQPIALKDPSAQSLRSGAPLLEIYREVLAHADEILEDEGLESRYLEEAMALHMTSSHESMAPMVRVALTHEETKRAHRSPHRYRHLNMASSDDVNSVVKIDLLYEDHKSWVLVEYMLHDENIQVTPEELMAQHFVSLDRCRKMLGACGFLIGECGVYRLDDGQYHSRTYGENQAGG